MLSELIGIYLASSDLLGLYSLPELLGSDYALRILGSAFGGSVGLVLDFRKEEYAHSNSTMNNVNS